jgi:competence protein ComEC
MRSTILGFVAGAAFLQTRATLPAAWQIGACLFAACALLLALRGPVRAALAGALAGFAWAAFMAHIILAPQLDKADEGRDIEIVGTVAKLPHDFGQGLRFQFAVEQVMTTNANVPPMLALSWYRAESEALQMHPGERWRLTVRLQRPHGNANPHGFDYEAWLLGQGIRATGYVRAAPGNRRLDDFVSTPGHLVERSRDILRARILAALEGKPYAAVIVALVVGDQRGIEQPDWDVFNRTGVSHLVAISGLHITMVAGLAALAMSSLWRRSFFTHLQLPLLLPAQKVAALSGACAALVYVLLAGFGVPAQRTLYMLAVVAAALWMGRLTSVTHILCLALGLVVLLDPWAVLWPGFWLSFGAVGVILYAGLGRLDESSAGWRGTLALAARTQYAVTLGLVPLTLLLFSQVSLVGPIANAFAIPVVSFVVTPLALLGSMLPAPLDGPVLWCAHLVLEWLAAALGWLATLPLAVWSAPAPPAWLFVLALAGTGWMLAPRGWPHRWAGAAAWLPLFLLQPAHPGARQFCGDRLRRRPGHGAAGGDERPPAALRHRPAVRARPGCGRARDPALPARTRHQAPGHGRRLAQRRRSRGRRADATGGAVVDRVSSSLGEGHRVVHAARRHERCVAGQRWEWDGVVFEMLQPTLASYADTASRRMRAAAPCASRRREGSAAGGRYRSGAGSGPGQP